MKMKRRSAALALALALVLPGVLGLAAAKDKKKKEPPTRVVKGMVTDDAEDPISGVIQLKNTKTLDVRSFHVGANGTFYFSGLDPNIDYEVTAMAKGYRNKTRRVSSFDDRMEFYYMFKLKRE